MKGQIFIRQLEYHFLSPPGTEKHFGLLNLANKTYDKGEYPLTESLKNSAHCVFLVNILIKMGGNHFASFPPMRNKLAPN